MKSIHSHGVCFYAGLIIQSVMPGFVATNMTRVRKGTTMTPLPEDYARSAIATIGVDSVTHGYWSHWVMMLAYHLCCWVYPTGFYRGIRDRMYDRIQKVKHLIKQKKSQ